MVSWMRSDEGLSRNISDSNWYPKLEGGTYIEEVLLDLFKAVDVKVVYDDDCSCWRLVVVR